MICEVCHQRFSAHVPECCPDCQKAVENEGVEMHREMEAENARLTAQIEAAYREGWRDGNQNGGIDPCCNCDEGWRDSKARAVLEGK